MLNCLQDYACQFLKFSYSSLRSSYRNMVLYLDKTSIVSVRWFQKSSLSGPLPWMQQIHNLSTREALSKGGVFNATELQKSDVILPYLWASNSLNFAFPVTHMEKRQSKITWLGLSLLTGSQDINTTLYLVQVPIFKAGVELAV